MTNITERVDGRLVRGERTRRAILTEAIGVASVGGLEALSLGGLAEQLHVSKSGVFAHFGSKEELQLATVKAARARFIEYVVTPALRHPAGVRRVWTLCQRRLDYMCDCPGGCFFYSVSAEYDARPGRIRDLLAEYRLEWRSKLERAIHDAQRAGELRGDVDPGLLAFELDAYAVAANGDARLHEDDAYYRRARRAILHRLRELATDPGQLPRRT